jgi:methylenetetrahydrofolate dehydrogenase (NADP+)/methenyltetrahydrofolate cyclohydrolase
MHFPHQLVAAQHVYSRVRDCSVSARIIDGVRIAKIVRRKCAEKAAALQLRGVTPGLAVILIGDNSASRLYVRNKVRACHDVGIASFEFTFPANVKPSVAPDCRQAN